MVRPNMQNLTRNTLILLAISLVLVPGASAQALVDLSATADVQAHADASGAFRAVDQAKADAERAAGELEAKANAIRGDVQAKAEATLEQTEAQAQAGAEASLSFGEKAAAQIQQAIEAVKEFAASLSGRVHVEADADLEGVIEG